MTGDPPQPSGHDPPQQPPEPDPAPGPAAPVPWTRALPDSASPPNPDSWTLPPVPEVYAPIPLPIDRGRGRMVRILAIVLMVVTVLVVIGFIVVAVGRHNSRFTIVSSSSTDGTFVAGRCVSLSASRVTQADCGGAHDAQIIQVIQGRQACPIGTEEFDVNDGTGNLCLDRGNNAKS